MSKVVKAAEYLRADDESLGWCTVCERFTRSGTEPDACGYACPECGSLTVVGCEAGFELGAFDIDVAGAVLGR